MPWLPELFSAPALARLEEQRRERLAEVPFFDGLMTGEIDALMGSFAGEPEVHHPLRGRVKGASAFGRFVTDMTSWMAERNVTVKDVNFHRHAFGRGRRIRAPPRRRRRPDRAAVGRRRKPRPGCPHDRAAHDFSRWPLTGGHQVRPPLLQPDPDLHEPDVVGDYQRALAAGDVDAAVAAFEPDGYVREPAGGAYTHRGTDALRALYALFFSNGGGIPLEHCAVTDDGRACALEYNVVAWGRTELPPEAGIAVYVRGDSGKLAAARIYDDVDPPLSRHS